MHAQLIEVLRKCGPSACVQAPARLRLSFLMLALPACTSLGYACSCVPSTLSDINSHTIIDHIGAELNLDKCGSSTHTFARKALTMAGPL